MSVQLWALADQRVAIFKHWLKCPGLPFKHWESRKGTAAFCVLNCVVDPVQLAEKIEFRVVPSTRRFGWRNVQLLGSA